jgi:2-succinyl-5-enolpyruvyl-6-hydroxy-3-cyclohexene-1-carboxylate synthase
MRGGLTVVLINNSGSGIFEHLPIAAQEEVFETYFATPQDVDFEGLCKAHDVHYERIEDWEKLIEAIGDLPASGLRVIELRTDRKADVATLKSLLA